MPYYGEPGSNKWRAAVSDSIFYQVSQPDTKFKQLAGPFSGDADFEFGKEQSSADYAIVTVTDLQKQAGDTVSVDMVGPATGIPIKNDEKLEGTGESLPWANFDAKLGYTKKAIDCGTIFQQQRTRHSLYETGRKALINYGKRYCEEHIALQLFGARGYHVGNRIIPTDSTIYSKLADNPVNPTTRNRAYVVSGGDSIARITDTAGVLDITTADTMSWTIVEALNAANKDGIAVPVEGCKFEGDTMGAEIPIQILFVDSLQYLALKRSTGFKDFQAEALKRASKPGQHLIFTGAIGIMDNTLIVENRHLPCRFFAGNEVVYASSLNNNNTATATVPAGFGATHAVGTAVLVGRQAMVHVLGGFGLDMWKAPANKKSAGYMWGEKWFDSGDRLEVYLKMLESYAKTRFTLNWGTADQPNWQPTDYGLMTIHSAIELNP